MVDNVNEICLKRMLLKNIKDVEKSGDFLGLN